MTLFSLPKLNPLALVAASLAHVVISALWFNAPFLWSEQWLNAIGKTAEQVAQDFSITKIVLAFIGGLLVSLAVRFVIAWSGVEGPLPAALTAGLIGLLLAASNSSLRLIFEGRPTSLMLINAGHDVISAAIVGLVLGLWH